MKILFTNDDGITAEGLIILERIFSKYHETYIIAPDRERSACSNIFTVRDELTVTKISDRVFSVNGYPADCVSLALHSDLIPEIDLVISGINHGPNLGDDVHFSGTVAGARTAYIFGKPGIAFSIDSFHKASPNMPEASEFLAEYIKDNVKIPPAKVAEAEECAMAVLQDVHSGVLYSPLSKMFCRRDMFFDGKKYLICPYENELKSGVLVAGFRFAIFDGENQTDAASISLCEHGKQKKFLLRNYKSTLQDLDR